MRKMLLNLAALVVIGLGGAHLAYAEEGGDGGDAEGCILDGEVCSLDKDCCVKNRTCYANCPSLE